MLKMTLTRGGSEWLRHGATRVGLPHLIICLCFVSLPLLAGCFSPDYGNSGFACSAEGDCPSGYECHQDGICHRNGEVDTTPDGSVIDADPSAPDADPNAPDADLDAAIDAAIDARVFDAGPPPGNDICGASSAALLTENVFSSGTTTDSNDEIDLGCNGAGKGDVFYRFVLTDPKSVLIELVSTGNTNISLLSDCSTEVQCSSVAGAGETLDIPVLAAGTYYLAVESSDGSGQDFTLRYTEGAPRPPNDSCGGVIQLVDGTPLVNQTMVDADDDASGSCQSVNSGDVVYFFDVGGTDNRRATITVSNAVDFQPLLFLDDACPGTEVECVDFGAGDTEVLDATSLAPGRYYLWVDAVSVVDPVDFDISLVLGDEIPVPGNDICSAAAALAVDTPTSGTTLGAADDYDISCGIQDFRDTVHSFSITNASSVLIEVAPDSAWQPAVALRTAANCAAGPDGYCTDGNLSSRFINVPSLGMGNYSAIVDGVNGSSGDYNITLQVDAPDSTYGYKVVRTTAPYVSIALESGRVILPDSGGVPDGTRNGFIDGVSLSFDFDYFGSIYSAINISYNGYISFDADVGILAARSNICPMDTGVPNNMIALFWDDLYASVVNNVNGLYYLADGVAPHRRFILEWDDWDLVESETCSGQCADVLGTNVSQQLILHENGDIEMHYGPRVAPLVAHDCNDQHLGCSASIGLKNSDGTDIDVAGCNTNSVAEDDVIYFVHPTAAP